MAGEIKYGIIISAVDKSTAVLKTVQSGLAAVGKAGESLKKVGESMRVARENVDDFTGRLRDGIASVMAPAAGVDDALAKIAARDALSPVKTDLAELKAASLAWSSAHKQGADLYIGTVDQMLVAGLDQAAATKAGQVALATALATQRDSAAMTETLTVLYGQMGNKTADAAVEFGRLGDMLTRAQQVFVGIDVSALADPMKDALPAAKAYRVSVGETIAVLGQLNAAGIKGGEAGAGFAAVLDALGGASKALGFDVIKAADGSTDLIATLQGVEAKFGRIDQMTPEMAAKFQTAFGGGYKAVSSLLGQTGKLAAGYDAVTKSTGATAAAQAALEGTTSAKMAIAQQQIDAVKVTIAEGLTPAILAAVPPITTAVNAVGGFAKENPKVTAFVGTVAVIGVVAGSVIGPILSTVGALASMGGALLTSGSAVLSWAAATIGGMLPALGAAISATIAWTVALLANPITWIVLAVVALVAVIYVYWEPISEFFIALWDDISEAFSGAWDSIVAMWDGAVAWITGIFGGIKDAFSVSFIDGVLKLLETFSPLSWVAKAFNAVSEWLFGVSLADAGANIVGTIADGIRSMASMPVDAMKGIVQKVRNLLPFSPAKDGPLRDLHKVKLVETVADAVRPAPLVDAMSSAAADAMTAIQSPPIPASLSRSGSRWAGASSAGGGQAAAPQITVQIMVGAGTQKSVVDEIEAWFRNPSKAAIVANAVKLVDARSARAELT